MNNTMRNAFWLASIHLLAAVLSLESVAQTKLVPDTLQSKHTNAVEDLCRDIQQEKVSPPKTETAGATQVSFSQIFRYVFNRSSSIDIAELKGEQVLPIVAPLEHRQDPAPVVIIAMGSQKPVSAEMLEFVENARWATVTMQRNIEALTRQDGVQACLKRAGEINVTHDGLRAFMNQINRAAVFQAQIISQSSVEVAENAANVYRNAMGVPAKVYAARDWSEISKAFAQARIEFANFHIVFLLHGTAEGILLDGMGKYIPLHFFNQFLDQSNSSEWAPRSLAIVACYAKRLDRDYRASFNRLAGRAPTYIATGVDIFGDIEKTILASFDIFAQKHARVLSGQH